MRLFLLELTRLRWRRAVVVLLAGCALATVVVLAGTAWTSRPVSDAELHHAQEQAQREAERPYMRRQIEHCERTPRRFGVQDAARCETRLEPRAEWYLSRNPLDMHSVMRNSSLGVITVLLGLLMLVGTTFAGADWSSGSMSNQLLFEPRRLRVWAAKGLAVLALAMVTSAVLLAAFWGAMAALAAAWDVTTRPETVDMIVHSSLRAVPLIGAAALGAYAVTMLFRSTVFTLGAMFAVVVGATIVMGLLGISEAWFPNKNLGAVLWDGSRYYVDPPNACFGPGGQPEGLDCRQLHPISLWTAVRNLGVLLVVAVAASLVAFRRRDVP